MASYETTIREGHLDTFGHVNNAVYLELLEEARWEMITQNGYGLEEVKRTGIGPIVVEINIKFRKEIKLRERITIETTCLEHHRKIGKIRQRILNSQGQECAVALVSSALFDTKKRVLVLPGEAWLKAVGLLGLGKLS